MPKTKYQEINLRDAALTLIKTCNQIIAQYTALGFTLNLRQLYYQCVARDIIPNKMSEYKRLGSVINDGRLAGLIDWEAIEDRTRNVQSISHWNDPEEIIGAVARQYAIDKWDGQPLRPEIWIEKDALVGVIEGVCKNLDVSYFSCRGYTSQSEMWGAAMRFVKYAKKGQTTMVIHLGDHDPSGIDMSRDIEERIRMFMRYHGCGSKTQFKFKRIALNWNQIQQYNPPPNPAKSTDSRFQGYQDEHGDDSWELDALDPTVIANLIRDEVESVRDDNLWEEQVERETTEKKQLEGARDNWEDVVTFLYGKGDHDDE